MTDRTDLPSIFDPGDVVVDVDFVRDLRNSPEYAQVRWKMLRRTMRSALIFVWRTFGVDFTEEDLKAELDKVMKRFKSMKPLTIRGGE